MKDFLTVHNGGKLFVTYQPDAVFLIQNLDTPKIMADAPRWQILEVALKQTATIIEIVEQLNQPPSQLYYHINTLEKHGWMPGV